jgi:AraC-like DNA-binding protein
MSKPVVNPLSITPEEIRKLRALKIKKNQLHHHSIQELQEWLKVSEQRAKELYALSAFQSLPSIGIRFAHDLISMGYYAMRELKGKDGAKLTHDYEKQVGAWVDPCVEDSFRLVVHYAKHPDSKLNWWDFTAERKAYREKHGYPADRPKKPWYELPAHQTEKQIDAAREGTQKDLHTRLKRALTYMKKHPEEPLTVAQLADRANLSQYHFIRCFKSAYELTPLQYLTRLRLKKASLLLKRTHKPVSDIVPECGFLDESAFIRLFKREFKMTPIAYRKTATK